MKVRIIGLGLIWGTLVFGFSPDTLRIIDKGAKDLSEIRQQPQPTPAPPATTTPTVTVTGIRVTLKGTITVGEEAIISVIALYSDGGEENITTTKAKISSSNAEVASVSGNKCMGISTGKALVEVEYEKFIIGVYVNVVPPPPPPANRAPTVTLISPVNNASGIPTSTTLTWTTSDPDGDLVLSDLKFGINTLTTIATNLAISQYTLSNLAGSTTYQWQVTARDSGSQTESAIWRFTTVVPPPPQLVPLRGYIRQYNLAGTPLATMTVTGVFFDPVTRLLSGTTTNSSFGRLSFNAWDIQNPPEGSTILPRIKENGELEGWARFIDQPQNPNDPWDTWLCLSSKNYSGQISYGVLYDAQTGRFRKWSWGSNLWWFLWDYAYMNP